jgi:hypothetical protein
VGLKVFKRLLEAKVPDHLSQLTSYVLAAYRMRRVNFNLHQAYFQLISIWPSSPFKPSATVQTKS